MRTLEYCLTIIIPDLVPMTLILTSQFHHILSRKSKISAKMRRKTVSFKLLVPPLTLHSFLGSKVHTHPSMESASERQFAKRTNHRQNRLRDPQHIRFLETSTSRTLLCPLDIPCRKEVKPLNLRLDLDRLSKTKRLTSLALLSTILTLFLLTTKISLTGLAPMLEEICPSPTATCILVRAVTTL